MSHSESPDATNPIRASAYATFRTALVTGTAILVPFVVTLIVLSFIFDFIYARLALLSDLLTEIPGMTDTLNRLPGTGSLAAELIVELLTPVALLLTVLAVGLAVDRSRTGERAVDVVDRAVESVPGVGSIYEGFRQMSDAVMESDVDNFRDVKVVEFPQDGVYTLGFVTTETPEPIEEGVGDGEMLTLFLPLAPNPVMGGHLVHVHRDRVIDVEMSVEEGIRAVVTTGVAEASPERRDGLSSEELERLTGVDVADRPPAHDSNGEERS